MVKTIEAIRAPFAKLTLEERGSLNLLLREKGNASKQELREIGKKTTAEEEIAHLLNKAFLESCWSLDKQLADNYGNQLEKTVALLVRELEYESPFFQEDKETMAGVIEREKWLLEKSGKNYVLGWAEAEREKLVANLREKLLARGIEEKDSAAILATALVTGGFTIFRPLVGFQGEIMAAVLLNIVAKALKGTFLPPFFNLPMALSIMSGNLGWITTAALFLLAMATPRRKWEVYIPAVLLIALARQKNNLCPSNLDNSRLCLSQWSEELQVERVPGGSVVIRPGGGVVFEINKQKEILVYRECSGGKKVRLKNH
ncbi:MAG: hypothetical protein RML10_10565 [Geminocystis sp.]|nr:hypothetical protein [Geminocystis sp.]MDW8464004.1 hypothetical protein [Geminocystis sp.]